jgi:hypothetical protein
LHLTKGEELAAAFVLCLVSPSAMDIGQTRLKWRAINKNRFDERIAIISSSMAIASMGSVACGVDKLKVGA